MIKSMTSFGRAQSQEGKETIFSVEMKSVNHRYLDMNIRMPKSMISLEEKIRNLISKRLNRGKIDVYISYKKYGKSNGKVVLDIELAKEYLHCLNRIKEELNVKDDISVIQIAKYPEVVALAEEDEDLEIIFTEISPLIENALDLMEEMRCREGEKLKEDIIYKLSQIKEYVNKVDIISENIPGNYKRKLEERLHELLGAVEIDENRIALEVAVLSDKACVDEEITRLRSHLSQMENSLDLKEPIGRKLDFIVQEMNREANTIASKSTDIEITNIVIEIKNIIEKIREQIQNIE